MRRKINPDQLSFSYGRPLLVLIQEIQKITRSPEIKKAVEQISQGLQILEAVSQTGVLKSPKTTAAIQELLSK